MAKELDENYKTGFISIFRSIKKHWIWDDPVKFKWWIDILLTVNYKDRKVNVGYDLFECSRGQSIQSLSSWAKTWNVSKDTVRNFFKLLEKDKMITTENLKKTTRLTVCNYDSYQIDLHEEQTQSKRKANAKQTQSDPNNKDNKVNKEINIFFESFKNITNKKLRVIDDKTKRQFKARIKEGYTVDDLITATENCKKDKYHIENPKYLTPEFITRPDKLQKYLNSDKSHSLNDKNSGTSLIPDDMIL